MSAAGTIATPANPPLQATRVIGFIAMVTGMFMAILDIQIVSASLSEIQAGLSASVDEVSWVQTSYLIAEVVMIPLSGFLSRLLSTRVLYVASAAGFTITSLMCGLATSMDEMILFRTLQGFIGGAMIPTAFATSFIVFGRARGGVAGAVVGMVVTLAPTIGPTLGGYLTELFSWHWLFFINVVPGIAVTFLVWTFMDIDEADPSLLQTIDIPGLVSMALFLGSLQYVLEEGARNDWFEDVWVTRMAAIAAISSVFFFTRVLTARHPIVDLSAFRNVNFATGSALAFMLGIGLYGITYVLPAYLARVQDYSSLQIGEFLWVTGICMFIGGPISGMLGRVIDPRLIIATAFTFLAFACFFFAQLTSESGYWDLFFAQVLRGFGLMFAMIQINVLSMATLPPEAIKNASGLFNLMRNLGGALGLAVINTIISERTVMHWSRLREHITESDPQTQAFLSSFAARYESHFLGDGTAAGMKMLGLLTEQQALVMSFSDVFYVLMMCFIVILVGAPLLRRPAAPSAAIEAH